MIDPGTLLLDDTLLPQGRSLRFSRPLQVLTARTAGDARTALDQLSRLLDAGHWVAGYLSYELGFLFEERLTGFVPKESLTPLLWLGVYEAPERLERSDFLALLADETAGKLGHARNLIPDWDFPRYLQAFEKVQAYIAAGDIYQANLTFRAHFNLEGDAFALYRELVRAQPVRYGAFLDAGDHYLLSRSPELFIEGRPGLIRTRPMKGTLKRGRTVAEDEAGRQALRADEKSRAENLMIVDLLRNDLGRIAEIGSVKVTDLFTIETYRSLHQMTSSIEARPRSGLSPADLIPALFPCGSVTGAPKIRAMEIIRELEAAPRGVYTGAIGYISPQEEFCFSVAIRTIRIDAAGHGEIGIGGGIVADSEARSEYEEALLKMKFLSDPAEPIGLIETLLWEQRTGYWLLERHMQRLGQSAAYFQLPFDKEALIALLDTHAQGFAEPRMRVRLLLHETDGTAITATPLPPPPERPFRFVLADAPLDSSSPYLFHKTTRRDFYDQPRLKAAERFGVDEVVFSNERGELTEGSITSLFVERDGQLLTPAAHCGLLPGTLRAELLESGRAREAVITTEDLEAASVILLGNSVRGLMPAEWVKLPQ